VAYRYSQKQLLHALLTSTLLPPCPTDACPSPDLSLDTVDEDVLLVKSAPALNDKQMQQAVSEFNTWFDTQAKANGSVRFLTPSPPHTHIYTKHQTQSYACLEVLTPNADPDSSAVVFPLWPQVNLLKAEVVPGMRLGAFATQVRPRPHLFRFNSNQEPHITALASPAQMKSHPTGRARKKHSKLADASRYNVSVLCD
jgi:hypothetical protein